MDNIDLLKEILMTDFEYWIVAKKEFTSRLGEMSREPDQILLISIPPEIKRGLEYDDIKLKDVVKLYTSYADKNIFITGECPPFQLYISFRGIYAGFPIKKNIKQFMVAALELKSNDIYDYKKLIDG